MFLIQYKSRALDSPQSLGGHTLFCIYNQTCILSLSISLVVSDLFMILLQVNINSLPSLLKFFFVIIIPRKDIIAFVCPQLLWYLTCVDVTFVESTPFFLDTAVNNAP